MGRESLSGDARFSDQPQLDWKRAYHRWRYRRRQRKPKPVGPMLLEVDRTTKPHLNAIITLLGGQPVNFTPSPAQRQRLTPAIGVREMMSGRAIQFRSNIFA